MEKNDNTLQVLTHLLSIFFGIIIPLVIFFSTKNKNLKEHSKKNLNWQISVFIYFIIILISFIYSILSLEIILVIACIFLFIILSAINWIFCIIAAVKANKNELWDYPLAIRFL